MKNPIKSIKKYSIYSEFGTQKFYHKLDECFDEIDDTLEPKPDEYLIVCGSSLTKKLSQDIIKNLPNRNFIREEVKNPTPEAATRVRERIQKEMHTGKKPLVLALGGGTPIDIAKSAAGDEGQHVVSIPTQSSHDGIVSNRVTLTGRKPYSLQSKPPYAVILLWDILYKQPPTAVAKGFGDGIAKITSTKDWELSSKYRSYEWVKEKPYDQKIAKEVSEGALKLIETVNEMKEKGKFNPLNPLWKKGVEVLTYKLIDFGEKMTEVGSSVPCSGSEHLVAHGWNGSKDHGYKVSLGQRLCLKLYEDHLSKLELKSSELKKLQEYLQMPLKITELEKTSEQAIKGVIKGVKLGEGRGRFTILSYLTEEEGIDFNEDFVENYLKKTSLI